MEAQALSTLQVAELLNNNIEKVSTVKEIKAIGDKEVSVLFEGGSVVAYVKSGSVIITIKGFYSGLRVDNVKAFCENVETYIKVPTDIAEFHKLVVLIYKDKIFNVDISDEIMNSEDEAYFKIETNGDELIIDESIFKHGSKNLSSTMTTIALFARHKYFSYPSIKYIERCEKLNPLQTMGYRDCNIINSKNDVIRLMFVISEKALTVRLVILNNPLATVHFVTPFKQFKELDVSLFKDPTDMDSILKGLIKLTGHYDMVGEFVSYKGIAINTQDFVKAILKLESIRKYNS